MAPCKDIQKILAYSEKELALWKSCSKAGKVPTSFVSLTSAEEKFGVSFKV